MSGTIDFEPDATGVTEPIPWLRTKLVALAVVHNREEDEPVCMVDGFTESVQTGAAGGGGGGVPAHVGAVMVSVSVVTVPPNANDLPLHTVFAPTVMPALLISVPAKVVLAASVVAALGVQKTSHVDAPFSVITAPAVVVSAPAGLKI